MKAFWFQRWRLLASLILVGVIQRLSPWARADEPQWFKLNGLPEPRVGLELDGSSETTSVGGSSSTYDTLFITPTVGLRTSGSIYHPNLLSFDFDGEMGWGWDQMTTTSPGSSHTINESDELNRYQLRLNVLETKPYNATFSASQDHSYRDYGSFDTFAVDTTRYDGHIGWDEGNNLLNLDFGYRDETDTGLVDSSEVQETYVNFLDINRRRFGQTTLTCRWDLFDNILNFGSSLTSLTESVGVSDVETFGHRKQITAATGVSFSHSEYGSAQTDEVHANGDISINHNPVLDSYLIFNFDYDELHPGTDALLQGTYGIRHQLYQSLTSNFDVHGSHQDNTDASSSNTIDRYGLGLAENYNKRLQSWGRLSLSAGIIADHEDDSSDGDAFTSVDESHQLYLSTSSQYRPVYLNRPGVIPSSVQVTAGGELLIESTDYQLVTSGELTEVRLIVPPSSHLQMLLGANDNLTVAVTYRSQSLSNTAYEALNSNVQIRLDLPAGFGVYGRLAWMDNNAPAQVLAQTLTDWVGGVDFHWRWFRTGAEYEDYDSNFSQYTALRFYQNLDFQLDARSSLNLSFNETFYHYNSNGDQNQYQLITRYNIQLWSSLALYVQGGCFWQDAAGAEQIQGSAQAGFTWTRGKLSVRAGYEYNNQSTSSGLFTEEREKNRLFAYLKRTF